MTGPGNRAEIAVIGGTGLYHLRDGVTETCPETPYGPTSGPVTVGVLGGRTVAFLPRHGRHHEIPPHRINARANLWALRELGVTRIIGPCAVGSLQPDIEPGHLVVLNQLVDRTWGREDTYLDGSPVEHVSFADPYCPELSSVLETAASSLPGVVVHGAGTAVVIQGPRFSTRAESISYRNAGWQVINMTQYPEAYLARELGLCYAAIGLVTDRDAGAASAEAVTMEAVMAVLAVNVERTHQVLAAAIPAIPAEAQAGCRCRSAGAPSLRRWP